MIRVKREATFRKLNDYTKWTVMSCMCLITITSIGSTYTSRLLIESFDGLCMYSSNINFTERSDYNSSKYHNFITQLNRTYEEFVSTTSIPITTPANAPEEKKVRKHIFAFLEKDSIEEQEDLTDMEFKSGKKKITADDYEFLTTKEIDPVESEWAANSLCEYSIFCPLWSAIVAIGWSSMLLVSSFGMQHDLNKRLPRPWRIVLPTIVAFFIMTILSILYNIITESGYRQLCKGLGQHLETENINCRHLIDVYYIFETDRALHPGTYYILHKIFSRITTLLWLVALLIMAARCFFVIDFELIYGEKIPRNGRPSLPATERSSKEDLDDFQSAYSEPDTTSIDDESHPSLRPLIDNK